MKFSHLMQFLTTSELYFPRADTLDDPYEGTWPYKNGFLLRWALDNVDRLEERADYYLIKKGEDELRVPRFLEGVRATLEDLLRFYIDNVEWPQESRKRTYVSCWHRSDFESEAMWKLYGNIDDGIAIRSSVEDLATCAQPTCHMQIRKSGYTYECRDIRYIDYGNDILPLLTINPFLYKRQSFEHEKEARFIHQSSTEKPTPLSLDDDGLRFPVMLNALIHEIIVAPFAPNWLFRLVSDEVEEHCNGIPVRKSELSFPPLS